MSLSKEECLKALRDYWEEDSPVYQKAFHRNYIESNFDAKMIEECEALVRRRENINILSGGKVSTYPKKKQRFHQDSLTYRDNSPEYVPYSGKDISALEKHMQDQKIQVSKYNPWTLKKDVINSKPGYLHYPKPKQNYEQLLAEIRKRKGKK